MINTFMPSNMAVFLCSKRQGDGEHGTALRVIVGTQAAAGFGNDAGAECQPQSQADAGGLGGDKGLEQLCAYGVLQAGAIIADLQYQLLVVRWPLISMQPSGLSCSSSSALASRLTSTCSKAVGVAAGLPWLGGVWPQDLDPLPPAGCAAVAGRCRWPG
jgi:hypothetical protein